jgi:lambda repressor-like predicted transcriptional regulator
VRGRELLVSVVHDEVDDAIAEVLGIDRERQWAGRFRCKEVAQRPEER